MLDLQKFNGPLIELRLPVCLVDLPLPRPEGAYVVEWGLTLDEAGDGKSFVEGLVPVYADVQSDAQLRGTVSVALPIVPHTLSDMQGKPLLAVSLLFRAGGLGKVVGRADVETGRATRGPIAVDDERGLFVVVEDDEAPGVVAPWRRIRMRRYEADVRASRARNATHGRQEPVQLRLGDSSSGRLVNWTPALHDVFATEERLPEVLIQTTEMMLQTTGRWREVTLRTTPSESNVDFQLILRDMAELIGREAIAEAVTELSQSETCQHFLAICTSSIRTPQLQRPEDVAVVLTAAERVCKLIERLPPRREIVRDSFDHFVHSDEYWLFLGRAQERSEVVKWFHAQLSEFDLWAATETGANRVDEITANLREVLKTQADNARTRVQKWSEAQPTSDRDQQRAAQALANRQLWLIEQQICFSNDRIDEWVADQQSLKGDDGNDRVFQFELELRSVAQRQVEAVELAPSGRVWRTQERVETGRRFVAERADIAAQRRLAFQQQTTILQGEWTRLLVNLEHSQIAFSDRGSGMPGTDIADKGRRFNTDR